MFEKYTNPRRTIDDAVQLFFVDHPRTPANVAEVITENWNWGGFHPCRNNVWYLRRLTKVSAAVFTEALTIALAQRRPEPQP